MMTFWMVIGAVSVSAWVYLTFFRAGFWKCDQWLAPARDLAEWPSVTAVVPARNEVETVAACVAGLANQNYPGKFHIVVVDDSSTDGTAPAARDAVSAEILDIIQAPPLERGWTGKLWALHSGLSTLPAAGPPDFVWFTDADIVHSPETLKRLVAKAETDHRDLVSLMVELHCRTFWERLLVPAFIYFFQMLYPFPAVNNGTGKVAGAAGGCILIRHETLDAINGLTSIRGELIDDCALAAAVKRTGGRLWLGLTRESRSLRAANSLGDLWHMITRTAFTQLGYSSVLLAGTLAGLAVTFLAPPVLAVAGIFGREPVLALTGIAAWVLMMATCGPTLRLYRRPPAGALLLPFSALLYTAMTLHSALNHWFGRTSRWKERRYAAASRPGAKTVR